MRTTITILAITALGLLGCSDDPQMTDVTAQQPCSIDSIFLATNTSGWVSYGPADTSLFFENDSGEVKVFRQRYYTENNRTLAWDGLRCNADKDATRFSNTVSFWYESEDSLLIFGNHYIQYLLPSVQSYEGFAQAPPYEIFLLSMQPLFPERDTHSINSCVSRRLANDFGNSVVRNQKIQIEDIALRSMVEVGNRQFENVFEPTDCQGIAPTFYYRAEDGVVAFVDTAGVAWYKADD